MATEAEIQERFFERAGDVMAKVSQAITRDGFLAAAGRQGIDEIGMALRPFPESIQAHEPGSIWNPLPSDIAASRESDQSERLPSPSEIADSRDDGTAQNLDRGQEMGRGR